MRHPAALPLGSLHDHLAPALDAVTGDNVLDMTLRAVFIYVFAMLLVRGGKSRMLSKATVFDVILVFVLGSMLSRVINGSAPLVPSLFAAAALVVVHALFARLSYHSHTFGKIIKGNPDELIRNGQVDQDALHRHHISDRDIEEALHANGLDSIDDVQVARMERDGKISIVPRFRVLEVEVREGVQRIRIEV